MSGQYPGHSRPPVGTPPPQTVWNHLTMTQGQGIICQIFCLHEDCMNYLNLPELIT